MRVTHWSALKRKQNVQTKLTAFLALLDVLLNQKRHTCSLNYIKALLGQSSNFFRQCGRRTLKAGFHMIADDRGSQIAESSEIVWKHTSAIACDPAIVIADESSAIICDRLRSCDHMETKVLRSAIGMYPIIFLVLTDDSTLLSHKARMFDYSNAHLL